MSFLKSPILKGGKPFISDSYIHKNDQQSKKKLYIMTLNTNGLRAALQKGLKIFLVESSPDILSIQETKIGSQKLQEFLSSPDAAFIQGGYSYKFSSSSLRQGYSGTAILIKKNIKIVGFINKFSSISADSILMSEGRVVAVELEQFILLNIYVPNSGRGKEKDGSVALPYLQERLQIDKQIQELIEELQKRKPVLYCGDLNCAPSAQDRSDPVKMRNVVPGCSDAEGESFKLMLENRSLTDTFRHFHPKEVVFSQFSPDSSLRLDYFLADQRLFQFVKGCKILDKFRSFSDHVPVVCKLEFE